jgi:hypothetical protein
MKQRKPIDAQRIVQNRKKAAAKKQLMARMRAWQILRGEEGECAGYSGKCDSRMRK